MHVMKSPVVGDLLTAHPHESKKNINGYTRSFSVHAMHRMRERRISNADIKFAIKNIATMTPLSDGRWRITAKNGMVVVGIVDDEARTFVVLTCYWPEKVPS